MSEASNKREARLMSEASNKRSVSSPQLFNLLLATLLVMNNVRLAGQNFAKKDIGDKFADV
jgi:hypothetical protein